MDIRTLYQELIIDHGTEPRNFNKLENASHSAEGYNPLCGDKIHLFLKIENEKIVAASFQGSGCAISTASASLMTESLIGKTLNEVRTLFSALQLLITKEEPSDSALIDLGKLAALSGVKAFPSRVKCATLAWHTMLSAMGSPHGVRPQHTTMDSMGSPLAPLGSDPNNATLGSDPNNATMDSINSMGSNPNKAPNSTSTDKGRKKHVSTE